jgi:hypothetical protein
MFPLDILLSDSNENYV